MIIGIDASPAYRRKKTGIEWYAWHVTRGLVATQTPEVSFRVYSDQRTDEAIPGVSPRVLAWPTRYFWSETRLSYEMLRHRPDVLFVPSRALPLVFPKRTVTTIHDVGFIPYPEERRRLSREYLLATSRFAARHASRIVTISEFTKQEIIRYLGITPEKISVVHLGFDREHYCRREGGAIRRERPYILCLGRRERRKNMVRLIGAYEVLALRMGDAAPDLLIVGPSGHHAVEIDEARRKSPVATRITIKDWVSEEEKIELLQMAVCVVHPSLYEGFGLPVIEAQACGAPVVSSNAASLPEVAGEGAYFVDPTSIEAITEGLYRVLTDMSMRDELVRAGLKNCERFSWEKTINETRLCLLEA